jgi:hypothetical protein
VVRVFVLYSEAPDPERYEAHVDLCRREVPQAKVRHGKVFGSPSGDSDVAHYSEFEFSDRETFKAAGEGLQKTAEDAQRLGVPFHVYFANVE